MTKPIKLKEYCPKAKLLTIQDIVQHQVNIEDEWNHAGPIEKWKTMKVDLPELDRDSVDMYMFSKKLVNAMLP